MLAALGDVAQDALHAAVGQSSLALTSPVKTEPSLRRICHSRSTQLPALTRSQTPSSGARLASVMMSRGSACELRSYSSCSRDKW